VRDGRISGVSRDSRHRAHGCGAHCSRQCGAIRGCRGSLSQRRLRDGLAHLSAAQGDEDAEKNRYVIAEQMTPAQIGEAQKLARDWKPKPHRHLLSDIR